jgi:hypothetical protein
MEKETKQITKSELITLLNDIEKSTFVNLVTETKVRIKKTGNPYYDKVIKRSKCNYLIGNDYEKRVRSNEQKEGIEPNFNTEKPSGKHHISKCVLVDDKTESTHYLMVERFDEVEPQNEYIFEGNSIERQLFKDYMGKVSESQKQTQEKKVMVITPKIENIVEITLNKTNYKILRGV